MVGGLRDDGKAVSFQSRRSSDQDARGPVHDVSADAAAGIVVVGERTPSSLTALRRQKWNIGELRRLHASQLGWTVDLGRKPTQGCGTVPELPGIHSHK
ncbi:hypothetical protein ACRE_005290 [Hapsidospora chrysogenum ATCC 11550]|uniref:Uncharacterized protein n=1 Tax=Hapsidospora chrysogenum (strain ATCC 11550 / CBS 779.69 / DSM 880 / IAM 14645 / JCM 23072 / IMI 49137) TaxID=857340 RepID=A0A086THH3_HAPC1|nr:hypothetical protein ACRE_005290 [Hapsidospora chrysogenum ATCC 11550]